MNPFNLKGRTIFSSAVVGSMNKIIGARVEYIIQHYIYNYYEFQRIVGSFSRTPVDRSTKTRKGCRLLEPVQMQRFRKIRNRSRETTYLEYRLEDI